MTDIESMQDKGLRLKREEDERLARLEIPTYENRQFAGIKVEKWDGKVMEDSEGWIISPPEEVAPLIHEGLELLQERQNFSNVVGWLIDGKWYARKSDQELQREQEKFAADTKKKYREIAEANKDIWDAQVQELPEWLRVQFEYPKPEWLEEPMGFGYSLIIARLAVEYAKVGVDLLDKDMFSVEDPEAVKEIAEKEGTSGNQHGMAVSIAKWHIRRQQIIDHALPMAWEDEDGGRAVLGTHDRVAASNAYDDYLRLNFGEDSPEFRDGHVAPEDWTEKWMSLKDFFDWDDEKIEYWTWQTEYTSDAVPALTDY